MKKLILITVSFLSGNNEFLIQFLGVNGKLETLSPRVFYVAFSSGHCFMHLSHVIPETERSQLWNAFHYRMESWLTVIFCLFVSLCSGIIIIETTIECVHLQCLGPILLTFCPHNALRCFSSYQRETKAQEAQAALWVSDQTSFLWGRRSEGSEAATPTWQGPVFPHCSLCGLPGSACTPPSSWWLSLCLRPVPKIPWHCSAQAAHLDKTTLTAPSLISPKLLTSLLSPSLPSLTGAFEVLFFETQNLDKGPNYPISPTKGSSKVTGTHFELLFPWESKKGF